MGTTGIQLLAKDAGDYPTRHMAVSPHKELSSSNVDSPKVERREPLKASRVFIPLPVLRAGGIKYL